MYTRKEFDIVKIMKKYSLLLIAGFALVSCSKVTESDLTRACTKVGSTPKYLASSVFVDEYYKLEDKAGVQDSASALVLEYTLKTIELKAIGGQSFQEACTSSLREDFMGIEPEPFEPESDLSSPVFKAKDEATIKKEKKEFEDKLARVQETGQTTNLYWPRSKAGNYEGSYDHLWIAAQIYKVGDKLELASVYSYSPKSRIDGYCDVNHEYKAPDCSSVYIEQDPLEYRYKSLSEDCDLGLVPFCEKVGKSLIWAEGGYPKYIFSQSTNDDFYEVEAGTYRGGMQISRKNLESQWATYFPDGKPREDKALYGCESLSNEEFTEKVLDPIQSRFNEVVAEEAQKLSEIEEAEEIEKEIESAPEVNLI